MTAIICPALSLWPSATLQAEFSPKFQIEIKGMLSYSFAMSCVSYYFI